ncbi:hypothetical protein E4U41_005518 [Claviceps citrina]|nr:hypothetical protein E4U41_005518 [Claviceps citrina]
MADQPSLEALHEAASTSIAQLSPENVERNRLVVDGVVTITWPYSIVTKSIAFILAEHDVLLRRNKGQLRVEFDGASGKALADARIGGGDKIRLSLEGAQWTNNDATAGLPAGSLEWQLKYTNRLLMSICRDTSQKPELLNIDGPEDPDNKDEATEPDSAPQIASPVESFNDAQRGFDIATPKPHPHASTVPSKRLASSALEEEEYASPAFIKRARVSYGSLFEGDLDPFLEKSKKGRGRRKSRFSMPNSAWRYSSRSASPDDVALSESEHLDDDRPDADSIENTENTSGKRIDSTAPATAPAMISHRPVMVDEGCQTQDLQFSPSVTHYGSAQAHFVGEMHHSFPIPINDAEHGASTRTPSRTLFGQQDTNNNTSEILAEPMGLQTAADELYHRFGLRMPTTQTDGTPDGGREDGSKSAASMSSADSAPEALVVAGYSDVTMAGHIYPDLEENHPSNPHLHESTHEALDMPHPTSRAELPWQAGHTLATSTISNQPSRHPTTAMMIESSPPPEEQDDQGGHHPTLASEVEEESEGQESSPSVNGAAQIADLDAMDAEDEHQSETSDSDSDSDSDDDGGDLRGEDYDLRNYAHTRDDDASEDELESESDFDGSDVDKQAIDFEEQEDEDDEQQLQGNAYEEDDEEEEEEESDEGQGGNLPKRARTGIDEDFTGSRYGGRVDAENAYDGEEEDEEEDEEEEGKVHDLVDDDEEEEEEYDDDDDDDEEEESDEDVEDDDAEQTRVPSGPREPVFISLLSDSDDDEDAGEEDEDEEYVAAAESSRQQGAQNQPVETRPSTTQGEASQQDAVDKKPLKDRDEGAEESDGDDDGDDDDVYEREGGSGADVTVEREAGQVTEGGLPEEPAAVDAQSAEAKGTTAEDRRSKSDTSEDLADEAVEGESPEELAATDTQRAEGRRTTTEDQRRKSGTPEDLADETVEGETVKPAAIDSESAQEQGTADTQEAEGDVADVAMESEPEESAAMATPNAEVKANAKEQEGEGHVSEHSADESMESEPLAELAAIEAPNVEEKADAREQGVEGDVANVAMEKGSKEQTTTETRDAEGEENAEEQGCEDGMSVDTETAQPVDEDATSSVNAGATAEDEIMQDDAAAVQVEQDEEAVGDNDMAVAEQTETINEQSDVDMTDLLPADDAQEAAGNEDDASGSESYQQLPTPAQTQAPETTSKAGLNQTQTQQDDNDSAAAEDQIMNEVRASGGEAAPDASRRAAGRSQQEEASSPGSQHAQDEPEMLITVQSLRSHAHRKTASSGSTRSQVEDPSLALAEASPQAENEAAPPDEKAESEQGLDDAGSGREGTAQEDEGEGEEEGEREQEEDAHDDSPRFVRVTRSSKSEAPDPSILLAKTSAETLGKPDEATPSVRITRSMTEHPDSGERKTSSPSETRTSKRVATPEAGQPSREAQHAPEAPSVAGSSFLGEDEPMSVLKRQLGKDLRTKLPDFIPLRSLRTSLNQMTDIMAVATSIPPVPSRPKHGPRDYMLELTLTDPSSAPSGITMGHIFRPHQTSLPAVHTGDVLLLRRVQVVSMKGRGWGVRATDASAWAVFERGDPEMLPQIRGPPVEVAAEEVDYAAGLAKWWAALDEGARGRIEKATQKILQAPV